MHLLRVCVCVYLVLCCFAWWTCRLTCDDWMSVCLAGNSFPLRCTETVRLCGNSWCPAAAAAAIMNRNMERKRPIRTLSGLSNLPATHLPNFTQVLALRQTQRACLLDKSACILCNHVNIESYETQMYNTSTFAQALAPLFSLSFKDLIWSVSLCLLLGFLFKKESYLQIMTFTPVHLNVSPDNNKWLYCSRNEKVLFL